MSDQVFPTRLKGVDIGITRRAIFSTEIQTSESGKELRASFWSTPIYEYEITFNFLRQFGFSAWLLEDEAKLLMAFFEYHRGQFESFLLDDPYDTTRVRVRFGTDTMALERFLHRVWSGKAIVLRGVK